MGGQSPSSEIYPGEKILSTHRTRGWVEPKAVLDGCKKFLPLPGFEPHTVRPVVDLLRGGKNFSLYAVWYLLCTTGCENLNNCALEPVRGVGLDSIPCLVV